MKSSLTPPVCTVTRGPKHHWFGFHDLVQWNARGDLMLALEVDDISHPPLPGQQAMSGVVHPATQEFVPVAATCGFNYSQGARQQWIGGSNQFLFNDRVGAGWGCRLADADSLQLVGELPYSVHTHDSATGDTFGVDYARLHSVGGYGYTGLKDQLADEDIPASSGIHKGNLRSARAGLLVSILDVARCGEKKAVATGFPHYLTHLLLNPSCTRLAFLHRYRLADGGETTRLMTMGTDGGSMRCLAKGFLSHFDWLDNGQILIWGSQGGGMTALRESRLLRLPGIRPVLGLAKRIVRTALTRGGTATAAKSFLAITDSELPLVHSRAIGVLTEDGHPMVCPAARDWLVNDTYPDSDGVRTLMLYQCSRNRRVDLGRFSKLDAEPDPAVFDVATVYKGVAERIKKAFPAPQYLFTRSGYHCDLHPRWKRDGSSVAFDSIHEGSRQIYAIDVSTFTQR